MAPVRSPQHVSRNALSEPAESAGIDVLAEPVRESWLVELAVREREDKRDDFFFGRVDAEAVQTEEEVHGLEGDSLVAVYEGMAA